MTQTTKPQIITGDCIEVMKSLPTACITSVVSDPPYGLEFMGQTWDAPWKNKAIVQDPASEGGAQDGAGGNAYSRSRVRYQGTTTARRDRDQQRARDPIAAKYLDHNVAYDRQPERLQAWHRSWLIEAFRVLKPGGYLLAMSGTRTYHHIATAAEQAGFEIRDMISWMYGSGFPKSHDVSKSIDMAAGVVRDVVGHKNGVRGAPGTGHENAMPGKATGIQQEQCSIPVTIPKTNAAREWDGWGSALKPALEPILLARKPLDGTLASNALKHGTGGLNIDGCRVGATGDDTRRNAKGGDNGMQGSATFKIRERRAEDQAERSGRWPANVILDPAAAAILDSQSSEQPSRFFYCPKPSQHERRAGTATPSVTVHPTVKPIALFRYLIRLVNAPSPSSLVLDPFLGSGTTGIACDLENIRWLGIEQNSDYADLAASRVAWWRANGENGFDIRTIPDDPDQMTMFDG